MRGEAVEVELAEEIGRDSHNDPVFEHPLIEVQNVLVQPGAAADVTGGNRDGDLIAYTLMWPKAYGGPALDGLRVRVRGEWLRVVGAPRPYDPDLCPTEWNMAVEAVVADG